MSGKAGSAPGGSSAPQPLPIDVFKGERTSENLVPFDKVDAALQVAGSPFERETRLINNRLVNTWKNLPKSVRDLWLFAVHTYGPRTLIVAEGESHTYAQMHQRVVQTAASLAGVFKIQKGDRVAIIARNHADFVAGFFAIAYLGAVPALVNAFLPGQAIYDCIRDVGCKAAIFDVERFRRMRTGKTDFIAKMFGPAGAECVDDFGCTPGAHSGMTGIAVFPRAIDGVVRKDEREWAGGKAGSKVFDLDELIQHRDAVASDVLTKIEINPEDLCSVLYTSGTTGKPKGVASTQRQFLSAGPHSGYGSARAYVRRGVAPPPPGPDQEQSSALILVPLFHSTGIQSGLCPGVGRGLKICLMPKYDVEEAARLIDEHKLQTTVGIGFMVRELMLSRHSLPSLQYVSHGGSSSAKELPEETRQKNPLMLVGQGYGSTEVNGAATTLAGDDYLQRPTSAGLASPTISVRIVDPDTLVEVPNGSVGEIWINGPAVALGYWGKKAATEEAFTKDGFFRTGDLGRLDKENFVYIMDRSKHIIIRGGENISGSEVESAVYAERRIIDCAAVPIPHDRLGETVAVVCVPRVEFQKTKRPTEEDILKAARSHLPKHAVPEFVWIRDEPLERNANGKVDKAIVKEAVLKKFAEAKASKLKSKM